MLKKNPAEINFDLVTWAYARNIPWDTFALVEVTDWCWLDLHYVIDFFTDHRIKRVLKVYDPIDISKPCPNLMADIERLRNLTPLEQLAYNLKLTTTNTKER